MTEPNTSTIPAALTIRPRDRDAILQSLRAGVVPRRGQQHIQVGRVDEVAPLAAATSTASPTAARRSASSSASTARARPSSSSSSAPSRSKRDLVTIHADLSPDRRLHATGGQARALYAELMREPRDPPKPEGGAMASVVERFVTSALHEARASTSTAPETVIRQRLARLSEMVGGYDFAEVVAAYWRGHDTGNEQLKTDAVRWLRGEFTTKTDARAALGVRTIVDDANFYDQLKLWPASSASPATAACWSAWTRWSTSTSSPTRQARTSQLRADPAHPQRQPPGHSARPRLPVRRHAGVPARHPPRPLQLRGAAVPAGRERLCHRDGLVDFTGPVLRLAQPRAGGALRPAAPSCATCTPRATRRVPRCPTRRWSRSWSTARSGIGEAYFRTPRSTIRAFLDLLAVLEQNPRPAWRELLGRGVAISTADAESPSSRPLEPVPVAGRDEGGR